ncbi:ABC transporter, permease protein [Marinomonas sp. MED121]|nr:ABC transporter, permease protein [Marinomonas sp. MED121]
MNIITSFSLLSFKQRIGLLLFIVPCVFALLAPLLVAGSPHDQSLMNTLQAPSAEHWFGTDHLGRDMWLRLAAALQVSLGISVVSTLFATGFGTLMGVLSAQYPKTADKVLNLISNLFLAVPGLLFILLFATIAPGKLWPLFLGVSLIASIEMYRVVRAQSMIIANRDAVAASQLLGFTPWYLLQRHYFPELRPIILRLAAFTLATTVLSVASLGFINIGVKPPRAELGLMMIELMPYYYEAPWIILQPIITLFILVLGLNLMIGKKK